MDTSTASKMCVRLSLACTGIFLFMLSVTLATGVSQQTFESVNSPAAYAAALLAGDAPLRVIITADDVFIVCYVTAAWMFVHVMARGRWQLMHGAVVGGALLAGTLDLLENHHILALLMTARAGVDIPISELTTRMTWSGLKWMLAHGAFFVAAWTVPPSTFVHRVFRTSLWWVQVPVGALAWTLMGSPLAPVLGLMRALNLAAGFLLMAWISRASTAVLSGSGAPA